MKILLAEDEPRIADDIAAVLKGAGMAVDIAMTATTPNSAATMRTSVPPAAIDRASAGRRAISRDPTSEMPTLNARPK